jgi:hypothetical protein
MAFVGNRDFFKMEGNLTALLLSYINK